MAAVDRLGLPAAAELAGIWLARVVTVYAAELVALAGFVDEAEALYTADVDAMTTIEEAVALIESCRQPIHERQLAAELVKHKCVRIRCAASALSLIRRVLEVQVRSANTMQERARYVGMLCVFSAARLDQARAGVDELPEISPVARDELQRVVLETLSNVSSDDE